MVKAADLPKTLDDLLNPKWSGKISIPDPTRHTTTAQFFWNLRRKEFKGDKWLDYVKALAKQNPVLVESLAPVTTTVIKGEAPLGITYIKYVKQYKGPVDFVPMDSYLTDPNYLSLSANRRAATRLSCISTSRSAEVEEIAEDGEFVLALESADQRHEKVALDGLHGKS
jgi:iron(III) transport system substrate-binding protein